MAEKNGKWDQRKARNTSRYRALRRAFLQRYPLCKICETRGSTVLATEIDHVVPVAKLKDPERDFWSVKNWQGLCRPCHEEKTAGENKTELHPESEKWAQAVSEYDDKMEFGNDD